MAVEQGEGAALQRLAALAGSRSAEHIREFLLKDTRTRVPEAILLEPIPGRRRRRKLHRLLRREFPELHADTVPGQQRLRITHAARIKCVAVDLDNTLWPGVLLEGLGNWAGNGGQWQGTSHYALQAQLLRLRA